jgi:antitoxin VapB
VPRYIRNEAVNQLENELGRIEKSQPLRERLRNLQDRLLARPATGLEADKDFYDDLSTPPDVR